MVRRIRRTATGRRDDPEYVQLFVQKGLVVFPIVAHVAQQRLERMTTVGLAGKLMEFDVVRLRPTVDHNAQEQVSFNINNG